MSTEDVVRLSGLCKSFGTKQVLDEIDLTIPEGSVVGLLGKNGAGKSTLLKCVLGLLKPTSGDISVFNEEPWHLSSESKSRIGYVGQDINLYPWMKVGNVVDYVGSFYTNWNSNLAFRLLSRWDLPIDERVGPLSQGQQQKLALVLEQAESTGKVIIRRRDGRTFALTPEKPATSPLDVPSIKADITTREIVDIIREGRER